MLSRCTSIIGGWLGQSGSPGQCSVAADGVNPIGAIA